MEAYDLSVPLENKPGSFAGAAEALANAGVNVEGVAGWGDTDSSSQGHFLVLDPEAATNALSDAGYTVDHARPALFATVHNEPGALEIYADKLAHAGVNVVAIYLAAGTRLVVVTDDIAKARVVWDEVAAER